MSETTEKTEPVEQQELNKQLKIAGITAGILVVTLGLLLSLVLLSRNSWNNGLRLTVAKTLERFRFE